MIAIVLAGTRTRITDSSSDSSSSTAASAVKIKPVNSKFIYLFIWEINSFLCNTKNTEKRKQLGLVYKNSAV